MKILLTNDDGIYAEGLYTLTKTLAAVHQVFVVAPDRERSATGHAITIHHPLRVEKISFHNPEIPAWKVDGTPSDCVKLAVLAPLIEKPDLIISGINRGPNLATDILYSGTVSAAVEGAILGYPSMALSLAEFENPDYSWAARFAAKLVEAVKEKKMPPDTLLNINFPSLGGEDVAGVMVTRLGLRRYKNVFEERKDPRGRTYYWMAGEVEEGNEAEGTDVWAIKHNYISVSPIHFDLTLHRLLAEVEGWELSKLLKTE